MTQTNSLKAAKQGDPQAIAALMNQSLQPKGITVKVTNISKCLTVTVESPTVPPKSALINFLKNGVNKLSPQNVSRVIVRGRATGQSAVAWQESFNLGLHSPEPSINTGDLPKEQNHIHKFDRPNTNSNLKSSNSQFLGFIKTRNGERTVVALSTFLVTSIFWLGISSLNSVQKKSKITTQEAPISVPESSSPLSSDTTSISGTITPKELPVLGNTAQQLEDKATVLQIVLNGRTTGGVTEIPEMSLAGVMPNPIAVKLGYPPKGTDVCKLPYSAIIRPMYEQCFQQGMSFTQVSNIVGWKGKEVASSGSTVTYRWGDGDGGSMMLSFDSDRLVSKSQSDLKP